MRDRNMPADVRPDFGSHVAFRTHSIAYKHCLAWSQLRHAEAAQRLHMYEDVWRTLALADEAEAPHTVKPFHGRDHERAGGHNLRALARRRQQRRVEGARFIHRQDPEDLQALRAVEHLADDTCSLVSGLETVASQA